jgi:putative ABC transport system permease protein
VRQLLIENVLLALAGGALGLLVVFWSLGPLVRLIPEGSFTAETRFSIDGRVLAFTALISIGAGILFGLAPAIKVSSSGISDLIKNVAGGSARGRRAIRARDLLIAVEVAIAVVLVCGAALLVKSFLRLHDIHPGFDTHQVLAVGINLPERNRDARKSADYVQAILEQIQSLPGVTSASASQALPFVSAPRSTPTTLLDRDEPEKIEYLPVFQLMIVSPDYFRTLRIPINAGRTMSDQDRADGPLIAVINQTAARMFWANDDPIGRTVRLGPPEHMVAGAIPPDFHFPRAQIVGVVGDVRFDSLDQRAEPQIYTSLRQTAASNAPTVWGAMRIAVRCEQDPLSLVQAVRGAVWSVNKDQPVSSIATLDDLCSQSMDQPRMSSTLMGLLAGVALILALIGIYGVISYSIGERRREIGIRIALGADRRTILKLVVGRTITFVVCGLVVGTATVIALGRLLETMMYGMSSRDPLVLIVVSVFLAATAIFASWRPAIRATRIDPMVALRSE